MESKHYDLDLGNNHWLEWLEYPFGNRYGLIEYHLKPDGSLCGGSITWDGKQLPGRNWKLETQADEHITVSPSLKCIVCPSHGFIRDGKWVDA